MVMRVGRVPIIEYVRPGSPDIDLDPTENDGRFYELAVSLPPLPVVPPNVAPTAKAGPDVTVTRPRAAIRTATSPASTVFPNPTSSASRAAQTPTNLRA